MNKLQTTIAQGRRRQLAGIVMNEINKGIDQANNDLGKKIFGHIKTINIKKSNPL